MLTIRYRALRFGKTLAIDAEWLPPRRWVAFGQVLAVLVLVGLLSVRANADVADRGRIEAVTVADLTLQTSAREAFNLLKSRGFSTGNLETYEDWWQGGLSAVKGDYNAPGGHVEIVLARNGEQLVEIREHWIRLKEAFDVVSETEAVRSYFGLPADAKDCKVAANRKNANCGVEDADQALVYLLTFNGDRQRYTVVKRNDIMASEGTPPAE